MSEQFQQPPALRSRHQRVDLETRREIAATYTDFAPHDTGKWETWFDARPADAVGRLLNRLRRTARDVKLKLMAAGDVAVLSAREGEGVWPLAFVHTGLNEAELRACLAKLASH